MPTSAERQKQRNGLSANRNSYDDSKQQQQARRCAARRRDRRLRAAVCYAMAVGRKAVAAAAVAADAVSLPMRPKGDLRYILSPCIATATG